MNPKSRPVLAALAMLVSLGALAVFAHAVPASIGNEQASHAAPSPPSDLADILPLATIHCCGQGAGDACRTECKALGPGCKGQIGCRAGECVCTCTCP